MSLEKKNSKSKKMASENNALVGPPASSPGMLSSPTGILCIANSAAIVGLAYYYNVQNKALLERIDEKDREVRDLRSMIETLRKDITDLNSKVRELNVSSNEAEKRLSALPSLYRIDELDISFIFPTKALKQVCRCYYKENLFLKNGGDNNSSKGFLIPLTRLLNDIANKSTKTI